MKLYKTITFDCQTCWGRGYLYYGGQDDYNIDPCDCVAGNTGTLFTSLENE